MTNSEQTTNNFNGFTLEELRIHRAKLLIKKELAKDSLLQKINGETPKRNHHNGFFSGIMSNFSQTLNFIDFALISFKIARTIAILKNKNVKK